MREILFESDGIVVYAENGIITEADERNAYEVEDTAANRAECIADAERTVAEWQKG